MLSRPTLAASILAAALTVSACSSTPDDGAADAQTIVVTASDDACLTDVATAESGTILIDVTNEGDQTTEVYVYGAENRVIGEVENITPGLSRSFEVTVGAGEYEIACKPGQTGDGIRTALTVTGDVLDQSEAQREVQFEGVDYLFEGLEDVSFTAGEVIEFEMMNTGTVPHEFEVFGPDDVELGEIGPTDPGVEGKVTLTLGEAGTYRYVCGIDDHETRGMVGTFEVAAS